MGINRIVINTKEDLLINQGVDSVVAGVALVAPKGPVGTAVIVKSEKELVKVFGNPTKDYPVLLACKYYLRHYNKLAISRVLANSTASEGSIVDSDSTELIKLKGLSYSADDNDLTVNITGKTGTVTIKITKPEDALVEVLTDIPATTAKELVRSINSNSQVIKATLTKEGTPDYSGSKGKIKLSGGLAGNTTNSEEVINAIKCFDSNAISKIDLVLAPSLIDNAVLEGVKEFLESRYETDILVDFDNESDVSDVLRQLGTHTYKSERINYYYPSLIMSLGFDVVVPASVGALFVHSSAGTEFPWTAPAGYSHKLAIPYVKELVKELTSAECSQLYEGSSTLPSVNPIIYDTTYGYIIDGARTGALGSTVFRSITTRKLVGHINYVINEVSKKYQYKPNVEATWDSWKLEVSTILDRIVLANGLVDYKLHMGKDTMTQEDIDAGRLIGIVKIKRTVTVEYITINIHVTNKLEGDE